MLLTPSRRNVLAGLGATALTVGCVTAQRQARKPNIVVILADDMGWSDIGPYGSEIATPTLDALAAGGLTSTRFYNTAKCYTTRAALLTGVYQHEAGIGGTISNYDEPITRGPYQGFLHPEVPTLAEMLRPAGYRSYHAGKWHVGEREQHWPLKRGFDRSFGLISGATSYYEVLQEDGRRRVMTLDDVPWTPPARGFYATDAYSEAAARYVREHARTAPDAPFFLYLAYTAPHWPLHAPAEAIERYLDVYSVGWDAIHAARSTRARALGKLAEASPAPRPTDVPAWADVTDKALWVRRMATHAAMVEIMDRGIGEVVSAIRASGQLDNTLILFLSDNGASHENIARRNLDQPGAVVGDRRSFQGFEAPWAWASNAPLRGTKESMFEGGLNTPFIAHWPAGIAPGSQTAEPCHLVDIAPTALALAGLSPTARAAEAPALRGTDLRPIFAGGKAPARELFFELQRKKALIAGDWKALQPSRDAPWMLFKVASDPPEQTDLAGAEPARLAAMQASWLTTAQQIGVQA